MSGRERDSTSQHDEPQPMYPVGDPEQIKQFDPEWYAEWHEEYQLERRAEITRRNIRWWNSTGGQG